MGVAICGLALSDPIVSADAVTTSAVFSGIVIGSLIPDIDTVLKLRNNAVYIRHHRGITHSIPAVLLWPLLLTIVLSLIFPGSNFIHVWAWSFLAVFFHVFVDIFNSYGTQALRPFSKKWVAIGVINTFDPIIFTLHIIGISIWLFGVNPIYPITIMYGIIFIYYLLRFVLKYCGKTSCSTYYSRCGRDYYRANNSFFPMESCRFFSKMSLCRTCLWTFHYDLRSIYEGSSARYVQR